ncbi:MAG: alpha/beta hydrolase [Leptolyngbyaceae cyanobacterium RU_5_1]|nr:alpha/beta hydrolase [Leptolyngbyaceae cyanobacterium RU_5_1]
MWIVKWIVRSLLLLYLALTLFAFVFSNGLIFQPHAASYRDTADTLKLLTSDGEQISALYLPNSQATYTLLYSHGNGSDLGDIRPLLAAVQRIGFAVFAYDYRGYGTSQGSPSEQNTYRDIDAAYHYLTTSLQVPPDRIILYGNSVGAGPSIDLASRQPVAGLIVEGAFTSAFRVMTRIPILPFDRFNNIHKIKSVRCPVLVVHGTDDAVIPFHHGQTLFNHANQPKQFLVIEGANHNDLAEVAGIRYSNSLQEFIQLVDQTH